MRIGCKCIKIEFAQNRHAVEVSHRLSLRHPHCCISKWGRFLYPYCIGEESEDTLALEAGLDLHFLTSSPKFIPPVSLKFASVFKVSVGRSQWPWGWKACHRQTNKDYIEKMIGHFVFLHPLPVHGEFGIFLIHKVTHIFVGSVGDQEGLPRVGL